MRVRRPFLCEVQPCEMQTGRAARRIWPGLGLLADLSCGMIWVGCNEVEVFRIKNRLCRVDAYEAALKAQVARWAKACLLDESQYEYEKPHPLAGRRSHWPPFATGPHPFQAPLGKRHTSTGLRAPCGLCWKTLRVSSASHPPTGFEPMLVKQKREGHRLLAFVFKGGSSGVRTLGLGIKSPLLCQLS